MNKKLKVLFICMGNTCRSVMAMHLVNTRYADRAEAGSAGTYPPPKDHRIYKDAASSMRQLGIDLAQHTPKHIQNVNELYDVVVNMSPAGTSELIIYAPYLRDALWVHWRVPDPIGGSLKDYQNAYRSIEEQVAILLQQKADSQGVGNECMPA